MKEKPLFNEQAEKLGPLVEGVLRSRLGWIEATEALLTQVGPGEKLDRFPLELLRMETDELMWLTSALINERYCRCSHKAKGNLFHRGLLFTGEEVVVREDGMLVDCIKPKIIPVADAGLKPVICFPDGPREAEDALLVRAKTSLVTGELEGEPVIELLVESGLPGEGQTVVNIWHDTMSLLSYDYLGEMVAGKKITSALAGDRMVEIAWQIEKLVNSAGESEPIPRFSKAAAIFKGILRGM